MKILIHNFEARVSHQANYYARVLPKSIVTWYQRAKLFSSICYASNWTSGGASLRYLVRTLSGHEAHWYLIGRNWHVHHQGMKPSPLCQLCKKAKYNVSKAKRCECPRNSEYPIFVKLTKAEFLELIRVVTDELLAPADLETRSNFTKKLGG